MDFRLYSYGNRNGDCFALFVRTYWLYAHNVNDSFVFKQNFPEKVETVQKAVKKVVSNDDEAIAVALAAIMARK